MQAFKVYKETGSCSQKWRLLILLKNPICDKWYNSLLTDDAEGSDKNDS